MNRREFAKYTGMLAASIAFGASEAFSASKSVNKSNKPNIVFILADDLGYSEVGCYGQKKIKTPNIDRLAADGMRLTQHYSGSPVCAPTRCTFITGMHTGHAQIRNNKQIGGAEGWKLGSTTGGQYPLTAGTITLAKLLKSKGYATGAFGKWGLGKTDSTGSPSNQGFDEFYGYICQRQAHTYYPNHLWRNEKVEWIKENADGKEGVYSHDLIAEESLKFIESNKNKPFFMYVPFTIPHVAIQVPQDSLDEYSGKWPDPPYDGKKGYFPHPEPRAGYAAMITRMDKDVGRIVDQLKTLGLDDNTLVIFTSDNGPTFNGGSDSKFFESAGPFNGLKCSVYEGGIRVPFVAKWPGKITPGTTSNHISAVWDMLATFGDIAGYNIPKETDGISILPTLLGKNNEQSQHEYLYWEYGGQQALRMGDFKAVRKKTDRPIELYNLKSDIGEQNNIAQKHPDIVKKMATKLKSARTESDIFPLVRKKKTKKKA